MTTKESDYIQNGKRILQDEVTTISSLISALGESFEKACKMVSDCKGRIVFTGVGQSAHAGRKSAASLASLGRPAFFVHATEALHGDMGMITEDDIVVLISHSGETNETLNVLSVLKNIGPKTIVLVGNPASALAKNCDVVLSTNV